MGASFDGAEITTFLAPPSMWYCAVSKVVNDDLDQLASSRVDEALVGQVSGVNIQATEGEAGSAPTI